MGSANKAAAHTASSEKKSQMLLGRLNRIHVWAFPWYFLAIIGVGYFFTFFDITNIGLAMPAIAAQFGLTGSEALFVALAIGLIGYILGSYVIGTFADRYGRVRMLMFTMALTAVGSFGDAAATGIFSLSAWRFITGLGVGAALNLVSTYIGELAPHEKRGRISMLTFLVGILGQAITPFIALALVPTMLIGWRLLFVIGGSVATLTIIFMFWLPESPRWQILHGRLDLAEPTITRMENFARGKGAVLTKPLPASHDSTHGGFPTAYLFKKRYASRLAVLVSMWFFWYIGNYGFLGDAATLLSSHGITVANSILFLAFGAIGYPAGAAIMFIIADRYERKHLILLSTLIWFLGMFLIGTLANPEIITFGSFLASLSLGLYLQLAYTFTAESYPTRARSTGFALSDGIGHLGGALGALALPIIVSSLSFMSGFIVIGITGLLAGIISLFGPSSTKRTLEQISD